MSMMIKKLFKRDCSQIASQQTEPISVEKSPEKLVTMVGYPKVDKKQILSDLRKYRHKTIAEK